MNVSDVMTKNVISVNVPGRRKKALEVMQSQNISGLPVVEEKTRKLVGMVTLDDLLKNPDEEQIAMIMRRLVVTIDEEETIEEAAVKLYREEHLSFTSRIGRQAHRGHHHGRGHHQARPVQA
jgi:CBS domain-containing protein